MEQVVYLKTVVATMLEFHNSYVSFLQLQLHGDVEVRICYDERFTNEVVVVEQIQLCVQQLKA